MLFSGRAYYNLLWLEKLRGTSITAKEWEALDYRAWAQERLFSELLQFNLYFDKDSFSACCEDLDSPEELLQALVPEESENKAKVYLIFFELWRRLLNDKISVSIFCDELDRKIAVYEKQRDDKELLLGLQQVVEILDRNMITEEPPGAIFERLCLYIAHDLESVIYTYINSKISDALEEESMDLIDHFMPYVKEKRLLQFLKLKSLPIAFSEERDKLAEYLVHSLQDSMNITLSMDCLFYLIKKRDKELFSELFSFLINTIKDEKILVTLLDVLVEYHRSFNQEEKEKQVLHFLQKNLVKSAKSTLSTDVKTAILSFL